MEGGGTVYARTDVGGAYRWDEGAQRWHQLLLADRLPSDEPLRADDYSVASIATAPGAGNVVYAAVGADFDPRPEDDDVSNHGRILRSLDGGATWTPSQQRWFISGNQRYRAGAERLAVDPVDPRHVLFGSQREGLWQSIDGGVTWTQVSLEQVPTGDSSDPAPQQAGVSFTTIAHADGRTVLVAGVVNHGVVASTDGGRTWPVVHPLTDGELPTTPERSGDALFVAVNDEGRHQNHVVRIDLLDLSTKTLTTPIVTDPVQLAVDPANERRMVAAARAIHGDERLWTTEDGGASWQSHDVAIISPKIPWLERTDVADYLSVGRLMFDPAVPSRLWLVEGAAVWQTDDLDANPIVWESASVGIEQTVVNAILPRADGTVVVAISDRQGFVIGAGADRYPEQPMLDHRFISGMSLDYSGGHPDVISWVGGEAHRGRAPDRSPRGAVSIDGGTSWTDMEGLTRDQFAGEIAVSATDPQRLIWMPTAYESPRLLAEQPVGIFVSSDGGRSWQRRSIDGRDGSFHRLYSWTARRALAADRVDERFYALSDEQQFYVTSDGGESWSASPFAPPCSADADCHVHGQLQAIPGRAGELIASLGSAGLYYTADAGATPWRRLDGVVEARAFGFGRPSLNADPTLFVHGRLAGHTVPALLRSDDLGATWQFVDQAPGGYATQVNVVAADPVVGGRVYVGFAGTGVVVGEPAS